jgi:type III secretion HrpO family protein
MVDYANLTQLAQNALWLTLALSLPVVGVAAIVSLVMALLQAATQVNDATIAHLPRFIAVAVVLAMTGGYIGQEITQFASTVFSISG